MFTSLLLLASLSSPRAAVPPLSVLGLEAKYGEFLTEHLAGAIREGGATTVTAREMAAVLGLERQRQLLGCTDAGSTCMAELAAAMGSDFVVLGDVALVDQRTYQVNLKVIDAGSGKVMATRKGRVTGEAALLDGVARAGYELARSLPGTSGAPPKSFAKTPLRGLGVALGVTALAAIGVGVGFSLSALDAHQGLTQRTLSLDEARGLVAQGKLAQGVGAATLIAGGVTLAIGVLLFLLKDDTPLLATLESFGFGGASWR